MPVEPNLNFLPPGITPGDFANMPPEHQFLIEQQMMQAQQAHAFGHGLGDGNSDNLILDGDDQDEETDPTKKKVKPKRFKGLLEWVLEQEGHEFMVDVDRSFIKNKQNLEGLKEKLQKETSSKEESLDDRTFNMYIRHLYKSSRPT